MGYRACIIGCGRVAWLLENDPLEIKPCTHIGAYRALERDTGRIKIAAGADSNEDALALFGEHNGVDDLYLDYREMLERERPDVVSICAYATDRYEMVMDCIKAGVKGIWAEKAFATDLNEAASMAEECERRGVTLIVSHLRRWSPDYVKAREMVDEGLIGDLQSIVAHFSGSLLHTGTHAFDVLSWFGGPVKWITGSLERKRGDNLWDRAEDSGGHAFIQFENGVYATVHAESKPYFLFEFDMIGSNGRIRIGNNELLEYYVQMESRHYTGMLELGRVQFPAFPPGNIWINALTNLLDAMEGRAVNMNGPRDGLSALEIGLAIHESDKLGLSEKVYMPLRGCRMKVRSR